MAPPFSVVEAIALKEGLLFARHKCVKKLIMEGDSKLIIQVVQDVWTPHWHLKPIIEDIKWLASEFQHISWKHIYRDANFMADALAHVGLIVANPHCCQPTFLGFLSSDFGYGGF